MPGAKADQAYEYRIWYGGSFVDHADPYAYRAELRPAHRSVVADLSYEWHDGEWIAARTDCRDTLKAPRVKVGRRLPSLRCCYDVARALAVSTRKRVRPS